MTRAYNKRDNNNDGISKLRMRILEEGGPAYMIAARAGISPSRISEYTLLQRRIPPHHVVSLCKVLKCNPDDIIGVEPETSLPTQISHG